MPEEEKTATVEEEVSEEEEAKQKLAFPTATIVRLMKEHIDRSKMIKKDVKIGMNKFLGGVVREVSLKMNQHPYSMVDYRMLKEAIEPYKKVKQLKRDKEKIVVKLNAMIKECESLREELDEKYSEENKLF
jgi:hypothetical protein